MPRYKKEPSEHIKRRDAFIAIRDRFEYRALIDRCSMLPEDAKLLECIYIRNMTLRGAAQECNMEYPTAARHHQKALEAIQAVIKSRLKEV